jgi:hypothetical protein
MPEWWQIAAAALGAVTSLVAGNKAASAARKQSREEARLEGIVTAEKVRQLQVQEVITKGETIGGYAGSRVKVNQGANFEQRAGDTRGVSGSPLVILAEQQRQFARERHVTRQAGASRTSQALQRGGAIADQYKYQGYSGGLTNLAQMFSLIDQKYGGD